MTSDLLRAVQRLRIGINEHHPDQDECIGGLHSQQRLTKQTKGDARTLKTDLERKLLAPRTSIDAGWINQCQE